jgi:hypothetical protein
VKRDGDKQMVEDVSLLVSGNMHGFRQRKCPEREGVESSCKKNKPQARCNSTCSPRYLGG